MKTNSRYKETEEEFEVDIEFELSNDYEDRLLKIYEFLLEAA